MADETYTEAAPPAADVTNPGILDQILKLLMPGEAEAASTNPAAQQQLQQLRLAQQLTNQMSLLKEREALKQADPLQQERIKTAQTKNQPNDFNLKQRLADILTPQAQNDYKPLMPGDVLSGGTGAPITFGRNPRTGAYTFNNMGWVNAPEGTGPNVDWALQGGRVTDVARRLSSPQMQQEVQQEVERRKQQETAPKPAAAAGELTPDIIAKATALYKLVKDQTGSDTLANQIVERTFNIKNPVLPGGTGGEGEAVLQGVDSGTAALVRKVANYEIPISGFGGMDAKTRARVLPLVAQFDPTFDATQYNNRMKLRQDVTTGKLGTAIRSINTVIPHLASLSAAGDRLQNTGAQFWNYLANKGLEATGDPRVDSFMTAATAVEDELATVFKNTGATDASIKQWKDRISASKSPAQIKSIITEALDLLEGRMGAVQSQIEGGFGKPLEKPILSEKSQQILDKLKGGGSRESSPEQRTQAAQALAAAAKQLGPSATPDQIKTLARKLITQGAK